MKEKKGSQFSGLRFRFRVYVHLFVLGKVGNGAHCVLKHHLDHVFSTSRAVGHKFSPCLNKYFVWHIAQFIYYATFVKILLIII